LHLAGRAPREIREIPDRRKNRVDIIPNAIRYSTAWQEIPWKFPQLASLRSASGEIGVSVLLLANSTFSLIFFPPFFPTLFFRRHENESPRSAPRRATPRCGAVHRDPCTRNRDALGSTLCTRIEISLFRAVPLSLPLIAMGKDIPYKSRRGALCTVYPS